MGNPSKSDKTSTGTKLYFDHLKLYLPQHCHGCGRETPPEQDTRFTGRFRDPRATLLRPKMLICETCRFHLHDHWGFLEHFSRDAIYLYLAKSYHKTDPRASKFALALALLLMHPTNRSDYNRHFGSVDADGEPYNTDWRQELMTIRNWCYGEERKPERGLAWLDKVLDMPTGRDPYLYEIKELNPQ